MRLGQISGLLVILILLISCEQKKTYESKNTAVFTFIFDDLNTSDGLVKEIFEEYNFKPSFAILSIRLDSSKASIYKSYHDEGISILSHSISHIKMNDTLTQEQTIIDELKNSKET